MTAPPRFEIRRHEHHGGGLFELEITIRWEVIERATGAIVRTFDDASSASYDGVGWSAGTGGGLREVTLADDGEAALLHRADGTVERVPLVTGPAASPDR